MNPENQSSKRREDKKTKDLEKEVENLRRALELQQRTIAHDRKHFGQTYEMI